MKICVYLHPFVNSYLNGTTFNAYELCQYLIDNGFNDVYMNYTNVDLKFDNRYDLLIPSINIYKIDEPFILLTNAVFIFQQKSIQDLFPYIHKIIMIKPAEYKSHLLRCINTIGYSIVKKMLSKLVMFTNEELELRDKYNDIKTTIPYTHGVYNKHLKSGTSKSNHWLIHTSEHITLDHVDSLKRIDTNIFDNMLMYLRDNNIPFKLDSNESITPYSYYDGLIYCKQKDYCARMCCEFLLHDKPIWVFNYSIGLTYYLNIDSSIQLPKVITREYLKPRSLWCDLDKLKELLQV